ncbi:F-box/WD repeat-containing protein 7-like isoform X2 [Artemia franciscana]|uniref:F-box/WD repeat-containing protein 7-like isoform X2 n=1 Tax=Artemia franciscana TaxID=6661 RepID=UPI0032DAE3AD
MFLEEKKNDPNSYEIEGGKLRKFYSWNEVRRSESCCSFRLPKRSHSKERSQNWQSCQGNKILRLGREEDFLPDRSDHNRTFGYGDKLDHSTVFKRNQEKLSLMVRWFEEFSGQEKTSFLQAILPLCGPEQNHTISSVVQDRLHCYCIPNCQDPLAFLPANVVEKILSFLDCKSLARSQGVCRLWRSMASNDKIWQRLALSSTWPFSKTGHERQMRSHRKEDGSVDWKRVFVERYKLQRNWRRGYCHVRTFEGHTQAITCIQFDGSRIVSGSHDKTIRVWDMRTNSPWSVITLCGHSGTVRCLHLLDNRLISGSTDRTIKMDEKKVVSGSYDRSVRVWNIKTGNCEKILNGHEDHVLCVQFFGDMLLSGSADKTIKVWDLPSGSCSKTLRGHRDAVTCISFDQSRLFSGSLDRTIKVWNLSLGNCINTIDWMSSEGHTGVIRCLQADASKLVSAADDRTLKVWSLDTGQRIATLRNHTDGVTCLQFNDFVIVSGSYDRTVKLWDFSVC